jgi:hypothetical protein
VPGPAASMRRFMSSTALVMKTVFDMSHMMGAASHSFK